MYGKIAIPKGVMNSYADVNRIARRGSINGKFRNYDARVLYRVCRFVRLEYFKGFWGVVHLHACVYGP